MVARWQTLCRDTKINQGNIDAVTFMWKITKSKHQHDVIDFDHPYQDKFAVKYELST